jgi:hypothetical protein
MTTLRTRKTKLVFETDREVHSCGKHRSIVVEPGPWVCTLRLKGTRQHYEIDWGSIFSMAARIAADKLREERKSRRKGLTVRDGLV